MPNQHKIVVTALLFLVSMARTVPAANAQGPAAVAPVGAAQTNPSATNQAPIKFTPARPVGSPGDWISDTDYPTTALRSNITGIVRFALTVSNTGIPSACDVVGSSMDPDLDKTTCTLLMQRAQFTPAYDATGKPIVSTYRSSVRWQIPATPIKLPVAGAMVVTFDIMPDGTTANCVSTATGDVLKSFPGGDPAAVCANMTEFEAPHDAAGKPIRKHVSTQTTVTITDVP